ncbi:S1 family peptidase [Pseudothauera rhizosphaerae]|uniref:Trypsin-like peptidase domain-containing protein n=1 Tax=Pseudothauera rhizosphaerae TaxID=2565932 RepID=A0A4S4AS72_9RHOO|nr:serine protease [Pseudothauera rhizosphaerae]THF62701.1 trypsin-like peptidase domain-containing protein [Pseudothauera rhizosphaerae]
MLESILLSTVPVGTFRGNTGLTNASGFFFLRDERLFLVTSRHVLQDEPSGHFPDRLEIEVHTDPNDFGQSTGFSIPLFHDGLSLWLHGQDSAGDVDVAAIEIDRRALPANAVFRAFTPAHLPEDFRLIEVGTSVLVVGFPLGFHDTLHHLPVVRQAVIASSFGLRFQGQGYFLTDARTHRGTSGAPVVMRAPAGTDGLGDLPWLLLGVHSARLDVGKRDLTIDEALGLNCAWYADIVTRLTAGAPFLR